MDPLERIVDTDALTSLLGGTDHSSSVSVAFDYCGQRVTLTTDNVQLAPSDN